MPESTTLPAVETELAELRAAGIELDGVRFTPGDDDAAANHLLRAMAACELELNRLQRAEQKSVELIRARYASQRATVEQRKGALEQLVLQLAARTDFGGKRKSREVAYGEYGRRSSAETIRIVSAETAIDWCKRNGYSHLVSTETKVVEKLPHKEAKDPILAHIRMTGEVPDGVEHVPASDTPYCKPDVTVLAAEQGDAQEAR